MKPFRGRNDFADFARFFIHRSQIVRPREFSSSLSGGEGEREASISSLRQSWTISSADQRRNCHPPFSIPLEISLLDARLEEMLEDGGGSWRLLSMIKGVAV